jgi:hypothetical protein
MARFEMAHRLNRLVCGTTLLLSGVAILSTACGSRSSDNPDSFDFGANAGSDNAYPSLGGSGAGGSSVTGGRTGNDATGGRAGLGGSANGGGATGEPVRSAGGATLGLGGSTARGGTTAIGTGGSARAGGPKAGGASGGAISRGGSPGTAGGGGRAAAGTGGLVGSGGQEATVGGAGAVGGSAGAASVGGMGNAAHCPGLAPNMNETCDDAALSCTYVGERCRCQQQFGPRANLSWRCAGSGPACPAATPSDGAACVGNLQCPYPGADQCNCRNGQWSCFIPGCSPAKPTPGTSCGVVTGQCNYGNSSACLCVQGSWFCN